MSSVTLKERIQSVPEEYLDEISEYIDYILFKVNRQKEKNLQNVSRYFGCISKEIDGIKVQRSIRNEKFSCFMQKAFMELIPKEVPE